MSGLAHELLPELKAIANIHEYRKVYFVEMLVGVVHGVSAGDLEESFTQIFAKTIFAGADLEIRVIQAGEEYRPPNSSQDIAANGFELLIMRMTGEK